MRKFISMLKFLDSIFFINMYELNLIIDENLHYYTNLDKIHPLLSKYF